MLFFCFFSPVTSILFRWRYIISFISTAAYPGSFAYFLIHILFLFFFFFFFFFFFCCFAPGRLARFHVRPESFRITVATSPHAASLDNRFCQMLLSAITFVIDVDISLYSSLHSVENV